MTYVQQIHAALERGERLTTLESLRRYGCFSLPVVIFKLRRQGHPVITEMIELPNGKHVAQYRLPNQKKPDISQ